MITYDMVLTQMEQALMQAKQTQNEQQIREQLTAIKALCDVVLRDASSQISSQPIAFQHKSTITSAPIAPVKMQESDANGDSIFDF